MTEQLLKNIKYDSNKNVKRIEDILNSELFDNNTKLRMIGKVVEKYLKEYESSVSYFALLS